MDNIFIELSNLLDNKIAPDHLKLTFSILFTYPSALVFKRLKSPTLKHLFSISYTSFILLFVLKLYGGFIHISSITFISYALLKYFRSIKHIEWINFVFVMLSMSISHLVRQWKGIEGDTELDYSGALMILTIKLSSFGFNVMDGYSTVVTNPKLDRIDFTKIKTFPTLAQYLGWTFFFGGFLAGPTCEYMDYLRCVEANEAPGSTTLPAMKRFFKSIGFMIALVYLAPTFNYLQALTPVWRSKSFVYKMLFIQLSAVLTRCKYYFVWYLAEGASVLAGFGFSGFREGKAEWNKLKNVNEWHCEFAQSLKELTENWNIGANHWLRHYVYLRFYPMGSIFATFTTYVVSSAWHGFQPGFYIFFITGSALQLLSRHVRKVLRPFFLKDDQTPTQWKVFYDISTWFVSMGLLNMLVPCFDLLHVSLILKVWREVYYCHFIFILVASTSFFALRPYLISLQKSKQVKPNRKVDDVVDSLEVKKIK